MKSETKSPTKSQTNSPREPSSNLSWVVLALSLTFLVILFFPALESIALICWNDDDHSHGLLLPLMSAYMLYDRKEELLKLAKEPDNSSNSFFMRWFLPVSLILFGMILRQVGETSGLLFASWIGFFPAVTGVLLLSLKRPLAYAIIPVFLLLIMAKPLPDSVVLRIFWPLQVLAAYFSAVSLDILGVPVLRSGNIIEIPHMKLLVEEACSGLRSVMSLVTIAIVVNYLSRLNKVNSFIMLVLALLISIVFNIMRVAATGILAHFYDPSAASGFFHTFTGLIVFLTGLPILYFLGAFFEKKQTRLS